MKPKVPKFYILVDLKGAILGSCTSYHDLCKVLGEQTVFINVSENEHFVMTQVLKAKVEPVVRPLMERLCKAKAAGSF